ncbi:hypothetical protein LTR85_004150 [Meristemomyces frigidus]|nr:hypothetical protein LTR85_004150 [Meristemomyces frigidus]
MSTKSILLTCVAAGTVAYGVYAWPYPPKSTTAVPFDTPASRAVGDRFGIAGATDGYKPGVATPPGERSVKFARPREQAGKERVIQEGLEAKQKDVQPELMLKKAKEDIRGG